MASISIHPVDKLCRLVQWRVDNYDLSLLYTNSFQMGRWNWYLMADEDQIFLHVGLPGGTPIASFNTRLVLFNGDGSRNPFLVQGGISRSIWSEELIPKPTTCAFSRMLSENIHTDITIRASDGSVQAHRAVLATRSPVFDKMFTHNLKEKDSSSIDIPDISIEACRAFLTYIYTNNIQSESFITHRLELFKAADKYDVSDLKDACVKSLSEDIDRGNVLERLQIAYLYRLPRLKGICIAHLVKFGKIFDIREEFNAFMQNADRELVNEVFNEILSEWKGFNICY